MKPIVEAMTVGDMIVLAGYIASLPARKSERQIQRADLSIYLLRPDQPRAGDGPQWWAGPSLIIEDGQGGFQYMVARRLHRWPRLKLVIPTAKTRITLSPRIIGMRESQNSPARIPRQCGQS